MAGKGGAIPGSGRKKKVDEHWARNLCIKAVTEKYGSLEAGIKSMLDVGNDRMKEFIWSHILGVPETKQKIKLSDHQGNKLESGILNAGAIVVEVVRTVHNENVNPDGSQTEDANDDSTRLPDV